MINSQWNQEVRLVRCPVCKRSNGHMCRDKDGKCVPLSHPERRREAMRVTIGAVMKKSA